MILDAPRQVSPKKNYVQNYKEIFILHRMFAATSNTTFTFWRLGFLFSFTLDFKLLLFDFEIVK